MTATQLKDKLAEQSVCVDKVYKVSVGIYKGCFCLKRAFFYRQGNSAEKLASKIIIALYAQKIQAQIVECVDDWQAWPKVSYFTVYVRIV